MVTIVKHSDICRACLALCMEMGRMRSSPAGGCDAAGVLFCDGQKGCRPGKTPLSILKAMYKALLLHMGGGRMRWPP